MVLTHSMMEWIMLGVLSLCLPVWSTVMVSQPYSVVSTNGKAQIQCLIRSQPFNHQTQDDQNPWYPNPDPEELRVTLLKGLHGNQEFCSSTLNLTEPSVMHADQKGEVQCSAEAKDGTVEMTVSGLRATDTDIYRCEIHIFFPPPYLRYTGNGTLIHVLDGGECPVRGAQTLHQGGEEEDEVETDETSEPVSVPVVGLVIAITCVLVIIIYFQTLQCLGGRRKVIRTVPGVLRKMDPASFSPENII